MDLWKFWNCVALCWILISHGDNVITLSSDVTATRSSDKAPNDINITDVSSTVVTAISTIPSTSDEQHTTDALSNETSTPPYLESTSVSTITSATTQSTNTFSTFGVSENSTVVTAYLHNVSTTTTELAIVTNSSTPPPTTDRMTVTTDHVSTTALLTNTTALLPDHTSEKEAFPLSPAILAVIAVVSTILFFVILYVIFKLVRNFKAVRFRRLHEMPMDDFDDYSGVYVEHTVPFRS